MSIKQSNEGYGFGLLANGLMVLAFGLPISSITAVLLNYATYNNPDLLPMMTIAKNYISLAFPFVAFMLISLGAKALISSLNNKRLVTKQVPGTLVIIVLSAVFTWLVSARPGTDPASSPYFLPNWILLLTIIIPYMYVWCQGINASYSLFLYKNHVRGAVYKHAINYLAKGTAAIIGFSIAAQFIGAMSVRLNRLHLTPLLLLVYVLIVFYALGFGWIARGAKKLKLIEEV